MISGNVCKYFGQEYFKVSRLYRHFHYAWVQCSHDLMPPLSRAANETLIEVMYSLRTMVSADLRRAAATGKHLTVSTNWSAFRMHAPFSPWTWSTSTVFYIKRWRMMRNIICAHFHMVSCNNASHNVETCAVQHRFATLEEWDELVNFKGRIY